MTAIHSTRPPWRDFAAIDPGVEYYAHALFTDGVLQQVGLNRVEDTVGGRFLYPLIIERPHIRREPGKKIRDTDIENLLLSTGRLIDRASEVYLVRPNQWKGSIKKSTHQKHHILPALTSSETALLDGRPKRELDHILDAIGIGLQHLERIA